MKLDIRGKKFYVFTVVFIAIFLNSSLGYSESIGFEKKVRSGYGFSDELYVEYPSKFLIGDEDGSTPFPIEYQIKMDTVNDFSLIYPSIWVPLMYFVRADIRCDGEPKTNFDDAFCVTRSWPAGNYQNGLYLSWAIGASSEIFDFSIGAPSAIYDWYWYNIGDPPSYETLHNGQTFLYLGCHCAYLSPILYGSNIITGGIEIATTNEFSDDFEGNKVEIGLHFILVWERWTFNPLSGVMITGSAIDEYTFIIGDDIPWQTDVELKVMKGPVEAL